MVVSPLFCLLPLLLIVSTKIVGHYKAKIVKSKDHRNHIMKALSGCDVLVQKGSPLPLIRIFQYLTIHFSVEHLLCLDARNAAGRKPVFQLSWNLQYGKWRQAIHKSNMSGVIGTMKKIKQEEETESDGWGRLLWFSFVCAVPCRK